jgi:redox-sensitive bicupin YhaK (pirin superfamily)
MGLFSHKNKLEVKIKFIQDANIFVTEISPGASTQLTIGEGRQAYLVCIEGSASVNGTVLDRHDAAEILGSTVIEASSTSDDAKAHLLVVEMVLTGGGRTDF